MRKFVVGDIHGTYKALIQCLERSGFNKEEDLLISLGDVCDGYPEVKECIDLLLSLKNMVFIYSNHDEWAVNWMMTGHMPYVWTSQGGKRTLESYGNDRANVPQAHIDLIYKAPLYYLDDNRVFVHGGLNPNQKNMDKQEKHMLIWDRDLLGNARIKSMKKGHEDFRFGPWREIYVGHSTLTYYKLTVPTKFCNVWGLDTGAGWEGRLSIMDIDTKEYWQSDLCHDLYPGVQPRQSKYD